MRKSGSSSNKDFTVRGSLITLRRKCGGPTCHCALGEPHETPALSYSVDAVTKMLTLRPEHLPEVRAALARHHKALAELHKEALHGIEALRSRIAHEKAGRRDRPR
jgi:hypothetical protein